MRHPLPLDEFVAATRRVAAELLGLAEVPAPALVAGRRREQGRVVSPGRPLSADDLRSTSLGPGVPDPLVEAVDDAGGALVVIIPTAAGGGGLIFSPVRTPHAVVTGLAMALAAAIEGGGRVVDDDLRLLAAAGTSDDDPSAFVAATGLAPQPGSMADAVHAYLDQFDHVRDWHLT